jgi:soluble lytic murein transglycosylase-like protein
MSIHMWTIRTSAHLVRWLASASVVLVLASLLSTQTLSAQALQPVSQNGHIVWTNDAPSHAVNADASAATQQTTGLFYWSKVERRWKPVRPASPNAMRSARAIASQVSSYIESRPPLNSGAKVRGKLAEQDPNYSRAADNRSVSAAEIDRYINEAAARHHVDPNLVRALVKVESNFNPKALSPKGAMGLMQLMPETARMYEVRNPFDAAQNVDAGVRHLKGLLQNFGGNVSLSLAAYNAGQGAVERNRGIPPYTETRNYVKRITTLMGSSPEPVASGSDNAVSSLSIPVHVSRDASGKLVITNTN